MATIKTLILNGSPRKNGDTAFLIQQLTDQLHGDIKIVNAYTANISPCIDCRKCQEQFGCIIKDEMQEVYQYLETCDNVVIASPIYFSELTGKLLDIGSRLQLYFSAKQFLHESPELKQKKGVVLLAGGGSGNPQKAYETAVCLMHYMNVQQISPLVCSHNTDHVPAEKDERVLSEIKKAAVFLNPSREEILFSAASVTMKSTPSEKIELFRSLFRGRKDVYALRWHNQKTGKSGYSPVCRNKWIPGICHLPQVKCADCNYRSYAPVTDKAIYLHLAGKDLLCRDVVGIYPMLPDETTYFLAIDFDEENWMEDVSAVRQVCQEHHIPASVERSRSGNGAHLWIFFDTPISAKTARQLGSCLLTLAMQQRHEIHFDSYDRMFPNQDTMPSGGFGNLIALPLQKQALVQGNSVFVNEKFIPYADQWAYLSTISKMQISETEQFIQTHRKDTDLGELFREETSDKPWMLPISESSQLCAYPEEIHVVISNLLYIPKVGITQNGLNRIKRLAAFKNPDFYKSQAMHMSTYGKPRVISLASEDKNYIMLPRGCKEALMQLMMENDSKVHFTDETVSGKTINVSFCGTLRPEQQDAVQALTTYDTGVLAATTAFGKTVTAAGIIAKCKVNTLILVHTQALLEQWKKSLTEFLDIHEVLPEEPVKRGRNRKRSLIGQLGSSKNTLNQIIDIAVMQSLYHDGEINPVVNQYGMVLVDECHHISAFSFEAILRETHAKYVYGLTATPKRSDGHQPIIFMQCGPIRYQADAKEYAQKHNFSHILIPRFTKYRAVTDEKMTITQHYQAICESNTRNQMISENVKQTVSDGRTPIVISERTFHITKLYELLQNSADHVIILNGKGTAKEKRERLAIIQTLPENESVILLATGKYIGEGFDFPRLDTLFLTMPISWSGTLAQYAGRLHREHDGKTSAVIYDYADLHVPMLENMYKKRLRGYAQLGYTLADQQQKEIDFQSIYSNEKFIKDLLLDIASAKRSLVICGGYYSTGYVNQILKIAETLYANNVSMKIIIKKSSTSYHEKLVQLFSFHGFQCTLKNHINHSFAIIDEKTVWYGCSELFAASDDICVLRMMDEELAGELALN